jgi:hypothetical protein
MHNIIDMMAIVCSNQLEFQRLHGHRLVQGEGQHAKHLLARYL